MMECSRGRVLEKINLLLNRSIEPRQAYEWALGFVVSDGYQAFFASDPTAARAAQVLLDVNTNHALDEQELKVLEYYRQCLTGQRDDVPLEQETSLPELSGEVAAAWADVLHPEPKTRKEQLLHGMRIYVYAFAGYVLLSNLWILVRTGGPWSYHRAGAAMTFPFFLYGFLLLLPMQILASGRVFMGSLVMAILAIAFFWWDFFNVLFSGQIFSGIILKNFFLGAVPASMALWLLMYEKYFKYPAVRQEEAQ